MGFTWRGGVWHGRVRRCRPRRGTARRGYFYQFPGPAGLGKVWPGEPGSAWVRRGKAWILQWISPARPGEAGRGPAGRCLARLGEDTLSILARRGTVWRCETGLGVARHGTVWQGEDCFIGLIGAAWHGGVRHGTARPGEAGIYMTKARRGGRALSLAFAPVHPRRGMRWSIDVAISGVQRISPWPGAAWRGGVRLGLVGRGWARILNRIRRGVLGHGGAGSGQAWSGEAGVHLPDFPRRGWACPGLTRSGAEGSGEARRGLVKSNFLVGRGTVRRGTARHVMARYGKARQGYFIGFHGVAGLGVGGSGSGTVRHGGAGHGGARIVER